MQCRYYIIRNPCTSKTEVAKNIHKRNNIKNNNNRNNIRQCNRNSKPGLDRNYMKQGLFAIKIKHYPAKTEIPVKTEISL